MKTFWLKLKEFYLCKLSKYLIRKQTFKQSSSASLVAWISDKARVLSKVFLDIQATLECEFTLKRVREIIRPCGQS